MEAKMNAIEALVKKSYKGYTVAFAVELNGKLIVSIQPEKDNENALLDFHEVDLAKGTISGNIPTMAILTDPGFDDAMEHAFSKKVVHSDEQVEIFLAHHGIKGQQWGVQNGPPYPLDTKKHNKVVAGSNPEKKKTKEENKAYRQHMRDASKSAAEKWKNMSYEEKKKHHSVYSYMHYELEKADIDYSSKKLEGIADLNKQFSNKNPPKKISGDHSIEDDMAKVNSLYSKKIPGTLNNCVLCSIDYDLRRRGYDVCARLAREPKDFLKKLRDIYGESPKLYNYEDKKYERVEQKMLADFPEGSRGVISIHGTKTNYFLGITYSAGHAMAFEVRGGKVVLIDSQSNKKYALTRKDIPKIFNPRETTAFRTDNLSVNFDALNDVCAEMVQQEVKHMDQLDSFLAHYGIKGQKWGVRRFQNPDGTLTSEGKARYGGMPEDRQEHRPSYDSNDDTDVHSYRAKDAKKLSDNDLRRRNDRLFNEIRYKDLLEQLDRKENPPKKKGIFSRLVKDNAEEVADAVIKKVATNAILYKLSQKWPQLNLIKDKKNG